MIPELGHVSLILAFCLAIVLSVVPLLGTYVNDDRMVVSARPLAWGQFFFLVISFSALAWSFVHDDFSVAYVANNSNSALPAIYKFSAVWGSHEGSLLLWALILAGWTFAVSLFSRNLPADMLARVLSVMGIVSVGFLSFMLFTSNPFDRFLPEFPLDGRDLNPLLQDFGLIVHPPLLYMGYVGFSVAFAFAIAALLSGKLDAAWARWSRPWTNIAWAFLTAGITLGSWWAYYELGWGGWWFWDPVENASFMPWLVGAALVHSLAATEKRGVFKSWTVLLAIFAFSLSLLGTFLVRSGVLVSVHAFATDPARGQFILALLAVTIGGSFILYALRAPAVSGQSKFSLISRESMLLLNNIMLTTASIMILVGTLAPLLFDALDLGKISVGPPYFNKLFNPIIGLMVLFMAMGPFSRWKDTSASFLASKLWLPAVISLSAGILFPFLYSGEFNLSIFMGATLTSWLIVSTIKNLWQKTDVAAGRVQGFARLNKGYYGMVVAHLGVAVCLMGVVMVSNSQVERDLKMGPGDKFEVGRYSFELEQIRQLRGPNYLADEAILNVFLDGEPYKTLTPEKRHYLVQDSVMTEAAIDAGLFRDLYVAMGEPLGEDVWAIRIHYKPFVRWLWLGGLMMAMGGLLGALDKRYRRQSKVLVQQEVIA